MQAPRRFPQVFQQVDHIDDDVNRYVAAFGFAADEVKLVAGTVDQHHPGPCV
ncbi:hypothetical protein [Sphaerimonospora mesophila]|uniref:hypothetical protein n=1 Tax=Sphaerimonospora mesophila TaxID=37483 RepID=UPI0013664E81